MTWEQRRRLRLGHPRLLFLHLHPRRRRRPVLHGRSVGRSACPSLAPSVLGSGGCLSLPPSLPLPVHAPSPTLLSTVVGGPSVVLRPCRVTVREAPHEISFPHGYEGRRILLDCCACSRSRGAPTRGRAADCLAPIIFASRNTGVAFPTGPGSTCSCAILLDH